MDEEEEARGWLGKKGDDEVNGVNGVEDRDVSLLLDGPRYFSFFS